jgi:WD40 repeat protein
MPEVTNKPVIFLAFANDREPGGKYLPKLANELELLRQALENTKDQYEVVFEPSITLERLFKIFREYRNRIAVFHFAGHANSYQLLLETIQGAPESINASGFAQFLSLQNGLELVVLNACSTAGHAKLLLEAGVAAVVATSTSIDDQAASVFAGYFYLNLAAGFSIVDAFNTASSTTTKQSGLRLWREASTEPDDHRQDSDAPVPWQLYPNLPSSSLLNWSLSALSTDPYFGLPPIPKGSAPKRLFLGLEHFTRQDAEVFFGRGHDIRTIYNHITSQDGPPMVLLYGQTGVGKSSLLDAGLKPRLEAEFAVVYVRRDPQLGALGSLTQGLAQQVKRNQDLQVHRPVVLILDQLEEVFTQADTLASATDEMRSLAEALPGLFNVDDDGPQVRLIFGFRKEFLPEIETHLEKLPFHPAKVFLEPLNQEGVIEIIEGPTRSARLKHFGLSLEEGLPERIATELVSNDSPTAPTLQILLTEMWRVAEKRNQSQPRFDLALYTELRRPYTHLEGFLTAQLDRLETWAKLEAKRADVVSSGLALEVLAFHTTAFGTAEQRSRHQVETMYSHRKEVLGELLEELKAPLYLLVESSGEQQDAQRATRLSHDTLAAVVRKRFDESVAPGRRARRILESRTIGWQGNGADALLDEADFKLVDHGAKGMRVRNPIEQVLFEKSRRAFVFQRIRRFAGWGSVAIATLVATGSLWFSNQSLLQARTETFLRQATNQINSRAYDAALLTLLETNRLANDQSTHQELYEALNQLDKRLVAFAPDHTQRVAKLSFSPDGRWLASAGFDGRVGLWKLDPTSGKVLKRMVLKRDLHGKHVDVVRFSPNLTNLRLASGGFNGSVAIWDVGRIDRGETIEPTWVSNSVESTSKRYVKSIAFLNDGSKLASGHKDGQVKVWDVADGKSLGTYPQLNSPITGVSFCMQGKRLIASLADQSLVAWNTANQTVLRKGFSDGMGNGQAVPNGVLGTSLQSFVVPSDSDKVDVTFGDYSRLGLGLRLRTRVSCETLRILPTPSASASTVGANATPADTDVNQNADWAILANNKNTFFVNNLKTGDEFKFESFDQDVTSVAISSDGRFAASGEIGGRIAIWEPARTSPMISGFGQIEDLRAKACDLLGEIPERTVSDELLGKNVFTENCPR